MDTLNDYARKLHEALSKRTGYQIYNRDATHAAIVTHLAFVHAESRIWLLSHKLDQLIYSRPWLLEALRNFLGQEDSEMRILVETDVDDGHPLLHFTQKEFPDRVSVKRVPPKEVESYGYNFMVIDDRGFRFEPNRHEFRALVAFDVEDDEHRKLVARMKAAFRRLDDLAEAA